MGFILNSAENIYVGRIQFAMQNAKKKYLCGFFFRMMFAANRMKAQIYMYIHTFKQHYLLSIRWPGSLPTCQLRILRAKAK